MNRTTHPIEPEELIAYLDGELSSVRTAVAEGHLSECVECQSVVSDLRSVSQHLKSWNVKTTESAMPPAITAALNGRTSGRRGNAGAKRATWRAILGHRWETAEWIGALAIVFVVVIGTVRFIGRNANNVFSTVGQAVTTDLGSDRDALGVRPSQGPAAAPKPSHGKQFDRLDQFAKLQKAPASKFAASSSDTNVLPVRGPMIIRTAELSLITNEFDKVRSAMESILKRHRGYLGELKVGSATGTGRSLTATLRIPADQLDATLTEMKTLGRVESETQNGDDVTSQYVDLEARLANARNTEHRLTELLQERTGKLSDVLAVENEHARVRGEIEQMEAERKNMSNQVSFATLNVTIAEDYKAQLQVVPPSTSTRLSNAAVAGYKSMVDGVVSLVLFLLENGPSLLFWLVVLFFPARLAWKRLRRSFAQ